jgi:release factor glutamine methyltransferase
MFDRLPLMELRDALTDAIALLEENAVGSPRMNAEMLLMFTLGCDRAYLYAHPERELVAEEKARYQAYLQERARGVPAQYIVGHQEFWGLDFIVNPAVLIPRPETEHLVEATIELAKRTSTTQTRRHGDNRDQEERLITKTRTDGEKLKIVDVGTGSGAIALALAKELPEAEITAVDISAGALEVARANAVRLQLERVRFQQNDMLTSFEGAEFDFVVSNPPYVGESEAEKVQREVRKFEPHIAVFGGPEGLDAVRRLIPQAHAALCEGGWLLMEIGYSQSERVKEMLCGWHDVHTVPDLQGIPRVVVARKQPSVAGR